MGILGWGGRALALAVVALLSAPAIAVRAGKAVHLRSRAGANTSLACPPQTRFHLPIGESVTGAPIWSPPFYFKTGDPKPIGRHDVDKAKICGPGHFMFSPMTCDHLYYSPDDFKRETTQITTECEVVALPNCAIAGLACAKIEC
mmetsp:Transcript_105018/g.338641  ORF Transcript_105018/g.338641 Transcript_105018/m.338641 type:complete len:145 (+) Transcript_105018:64-498(+)